MTDRLVFDIGGIRFLTAHPVLDGKHGDILKGGRSLDTWPH